MPRPTRHLARAAAITVITAAAVAGGGAYWANHALDSVTRIEVDTSQDVALSGEPQNYLVVGSDSRAGAAASDADFGSIGADTSGPQRSDTIMILRVDPTAGTASMLSLPRDLYVTIAGTRKRDRINTAFSRGPSVLVATIRQNFAIPINHYVEVDFQGFKRIVDAVGGVNVWFDSPVRDANTGLSITTAGCHKLNGLQALQYSRSRHLEYLEGRTWKTDGTGDLGRISRQQDFIRRSMSKAVETASGNPLAIAQMVNAATSNITVDSQLSNGELLSLAKRFSSIGGGQMLTYTFPGTPRIVDGNDVLIPNMTGGGEILAAFGSTAPSAKAAQARATAKAATPPPKAAAAGAAAGDPTAATASAATSVAPSIAPEESKTVGVVGDSSHVCR